MNDATLFTPTVSQRHLRLGGLLLGALSYALWLVWQFREDVRVNGSFFYGIDDAYIHLSMARNLAEHGTYGISPGIFSSASSGPLWTALLGLFLVILPHSLWEFAPFILGILCTFAAFGLVVHALTHAIQGTTRWQAAIFAVLCVLLPPAMGLLTLVFHGMEHGLHMLATMTFALMAAQYCLGKVRVFWLLLLAFAIPLVRFESLAPVFAGAGILFLYGQRRLGIGLILASLAALFAQGAWSAAHGEFWLPNSVLVKLWIHAAAPAAAAAAKGVAAPIVVESPSIFAKLGGLVARIVGRWGPNLGYDLSALTAFVAAISLVAWRAGRSLLARADIALFGIALTTWLAQTAMASGGPDFARYLSYLTGIGLLATAWLGGEFWLRPRALTWPRLAMQSGVLFVFIIASSNLLAREAEIGASTVGMSRYVDAANFVRALPPGAVAVDDLGLVSWWRNDVMIDIYGLANHEVAKNLLAGTYDARTLDRICRTAGVRVAVVADEILPREPAKALGSRPANWRVVGCFVAPGQKVSHSGCVFATTPDAFAPTLELLRHQTLSPRTMQRLVLSGDPELAGLE